MCATRLRYTPRPDRRVYSGHSSILQAAMACNDVEAIMENDVELGLEHEGRSVPPILSRDHIRRTGLIRTTER